jgi:ABC-type bacteriocin/lantibiotic exporter with double-glycine peptidase domain
MIAHRHESLRYCQRVLAFEGGRLVSDGVPKTTIGLSKAEYESATELASFRKSESN